jgi:hypothetical protein
MQEESGGGLRCVAVTSKVHPEAMYQITPVLKVIRDDGLQHLACQSAYGVLGFDSGQEIFYGRTCSVQCAVRISMGRLRSV